MNLNFDPLSKVDEFEPLNIVSFEYLNPFHPLDVPPDILISAVSLTPFIVDVKTEFENPITLELMIFTFDPVTPFTVVLNEFVELVFEIELTIFAEALNPFSTLVIEFAELVKVC